MRIAKQDLLLNIKSKVASVAPDAQVILYGSHARGDYGPDSDWDILILLNTNKIVKELKTKITDPLYDLEFDTGEIISPLVLSSSEWEQKYKFTTLYKNVMKEGVPL